MLFSPKKNLYTLGIHLVLKTEKQILLTQKTHSMFFFLLGRHVSFYISWARGRRDYGFRWRCEPRWFGRSFRFVYFFYSLFTFFLFYITICLYFPIIGQLAEDEVQNLLDEMASDPDDVHLPASVRNSYRYSTTTFTIFLYNVCLLFSGFCLHYFCLLLTPIDATRPPPVLWTVTPWLTILMRRVCSFSTNIVLNRFSSLYFHFYR